jgi:hypothetical protein
VKIAQTSLNQSRRCWENGGVGIFKYYMPKDQVPCKPADLGLEEEFAEVFVTSGEVCLSIYRFRDDKSS